MKKTITKIWGIGLIVTLLAGLFIAGAAPVSAGTLVFSNQGIPTFIFNQILANSDTALIKQASNGHLFAVDTQGAVTATAPAVYRSADGGRTWTTGTTAAVPQFAAGTVIADIAISPAYEIDNRVFVLTATPAQVYVSTNGGLNFNVLGGQLPHVAHAWESFD